MKVQIPYGRERITAEVEDKRVAGVIRSHLDEYVPDSSEQELVLNVMRHPIASPTLEELAKEKKKVVIIASDHTRPVPSKFILPSMLKEIRKGNPEADITILIATGCHRDTKKEELIDKFGEKIVAQEKIVIHDSRAADLMFLGSLPSGGELWINRIAAEADLLISEGFIEPHFFAGYSGGRKSVLPGIAGRSTVYANHCAEFIDHPNAVYGKLDGNPIHRDMIYAARAAKLAYIVNVVINSAHKVVGAFAGDVEQAHESGVSFLNSLCCEKCIPADIVVTSNNGFPLDQNIYQAVKGMATAEPCVRPGGVIIMFAACEDGCGGEAFYHTFRQTDSAWKVLEKIRKVPKDKTEPDQWQSQILARILMKCSVILISKCDPQLVEDMHMIPAKNFEDAIEKAEQITGKDSDITFIPEGISSILC